MIDINIEEDDAADFIARLGEIVRGVASHHGVGELFLIKIDNWFGEKWLKFSGKILGAAGVSKSQLTVPPFVPSRVVWERHYGLPSCMQIAHSRNLHVSMPSSRATMRYLSEVAPGVAILWFSGRSGPNGRAAIMAYTPEADGYWTWYTGWAGNGTWKVERLKGIGANELEALENTQSHRGRRGCA